MTDICQEELKENFDYFDTDGDGSIVLSEFKDLLLALEAIEPGESVEIGFNAIDLDGSGSIDFEEFCEWFNSQ
ncbi:putative signal transduction protein with EFhand domain [Shewanella halifaxensis HAW-EB4]|uniref:Signal transduction protein with EFhand domain n=1 Tax=Shewanella halifaxensis (strain HAW-EB4) TaxID=458817 RepID=B0TSF6_SHEHH|nr:EF-hand domain-containing protein [Shewanella halifaxensis]ABZ76536.1 putative signal transduction protein with EFhand domain [Shewanella halifaxensis HAW-EB4]